MIMRNRGTTVRYEMWLEVEFRGQASPEQKVDR